MISVRYLDPTARSFDATVLGWLLAELPSATSLRLASAYFDGTVLDWLEQPLEALIARGGSVQALLGSNGGQTASSDLGRLLGVIAAGPSSSLHVEYAEGGIFHPKVFVVESPTRVAALVGSANLTAAGSLINVEAGVVIETDMPGPPAEPPIDAIIASIDPTPRPDAFAVRQSDDLARLEKLAIIGRMAASAAPTVPLKSAAGQRQRRRDAGVRTRPGVTGVQPRTRRRTPAGRSAPPARATASIGDLYGLQFSANDLKDVGTREISLSSSVRAWVEGVLGRAIVAGEGTLFSVLIEARLAASPMSIAQTPTPVRVWAAGGSGGTHTDVRLVLGTRLKAALDEEAVQLTGAPIPPNSIGVFELPANPHLTTLRLTVFLPSDVAFRVVEALLGLRGNEQKKHFQVASLAQVPLWP